MNGTFFMSVNNTTTQMIVTTSANHPVSIIFGFLFYFWCSIIITTFFLNLCQQICQPQCCLENQLQFRDRITYDVILMYSVYSPAVTLTTGTSHLPPVNPWGQLHIAIDRPTCLKTHTHGRYKHFRAYITLIKLLDYLFSNMGPVNGSTELVYHSYILL